MLWHSHRVYRVPGFLSSRLSWLPPPPYPLASVVPPPYMIVFFRFRIWTVWNVACLCNNFISIKQNKNIFLGLLSVTFRFICLWNFWEWIQPSRWALSFFLHFLFWIRRILKNEVEIIKVRLPGLNNRWERRFVRIRLGPTTVEYSLIKRPYCSHRRS